jgi:phosphatidylglycerophosphate synthase
MDMHAGAVIYVPSDTPEAMSMATLKVAGVPVIVRGMMTLYDAGIQRCLLIIARSQQGNIEKFLERYPSGRRPEVDFVYYDEPYRASPGMIDAVARAASGRFLLVNANLFFDKELVGVLQKVGASADDVLQVQEGAHSLPIYEVSSNAWRSLTSFTGEGPRSIESCIRYLTESFNLRFIDKPSEINTFLIVHPRGRIVAEKSLSEAIRHRTDGPIARFINKRISLPISLVLSKLWISPNTITTLNIIIGVFSGVFVADGHRYPVILLGAALFQLASIIDGCDGEVAKLTFRCSKFGQYADTLCDNLSLGSFLTGLIAGYWRHTHSPVAFYVGAVLITTTAITLFWMIRYLKRNTKSASLITFDKQYLQKLDEKPRWLLTFIKYGKYTLKKDMFSFAFLCFAVFGMLYLWLFIAAFGTTLAAITLTYLNTCEWLGAARVSRARQMAADGGKGTS